MSKLTKAEVVKTISEAMADLPYDQWKEAQKQYWEYVGKDAAHDAVEASNERTAVLSSKANAAYANAFKQRNG